MEKAFLVYIDVLNGEFTNRTYLLVYAKDFEQAKEKVKKEYPNTFNIDNRTLL